MPALYVQLYSIREQVAADLPAALARLAEIGLSCVEPFDLTGDAHALREALSACGLSAPSAHAPLGDGADLDRVFEAAATVGVETVIHPFSPPERWTSEDGVSAVAEDVAGALDRAAAYGLRIGLGDQVRMLHLKDGPISTDSAEQLPLGSGAMPVPDILTAAPALEVAVLEFDDYAGDVFEGIATGYGYLTGLASR